MWDWLSYSYPLEPAIDTDSFVVPDKVISLVEGALTFLATLFTVNTCLGISESEVLRKEMVTLLTMCDQTHSHLQAYLPERCGTSQNIGFEDILEEISEFKEPTLESSGNLSQGMFYPKPHIWENEYDPIYVLLRGVYRRNFQTSLNRFSEYVKSSGNLENAGNTKLWPPFRISQGLDTSKFLDPRKVLYSKVLHGAIFTILYRAVHKGNIPDQVLALVIFILELALRYPEPDRDSPVVKLDGSSTSKPCVTDLKFEEWFESNSIVENINHTILNVSIKERPENQANFEFETGPSIEEMDVDTYFGSDSDEWNPTEDIYDRVPPSPNFINSLPNREVLALPYSYLPSLEDELTLPRLAPNEINMDSSPRLLVEPNHEANSNTGKLLKVKQIFMYFLRMII